MKRLAILLITFFLLFPAVSASAKSFQGINYSIIEKSSMGSAKLSIDIRLEQKVSKAFLQKLALKLRQDEPIKYDRIFICYLLPSMTPGAGAWATSHFNPNLKVKILGTTIEEEKALVSKSKHLSGEIIGEWFDESPYEGGKYTLLQKNGKTIMIREYKDGSSSEKEMIQKKQSRKLRFEEKGGNEFGEYYLIERNGNLGAYDKAGIINTMRLISSTVYSEQTTMAIQKKFRVEPVLGSTEINGGCATDGESIKILETVGDWYRVEALNGDVGWVMKSWTTIGIPLKKRGILEGNIVDGEILDIAKEITATPQIIVLKAKYNVQLVTLPTFNSERVGLLKKEQIVHATKEFEDWYFVEGSSGGEAWAAKKWLEEIDRFNKERTQIKREKDISEILAKVRKVPVSNYELNLKYYKELSRLDPDNQLFREIERYYRNKDIPAEEAKILKDSEPTIPFEIKRYYRNKDITAEEAKILKDSEAKILKDSEPTIPFKIELILPLVILLCWTIICGKIGALIGKSKKREGAGFLFGLFLGPIGWLLVAVGPNNSAKCPECGGVVVEGAKRCKNCGVELP